MADMTENLNANSTSVSPLEGEGLRGDGTSKWYVCIRILAMRIM